MNVKINGVSYQGPHAGGVASGILLVNLGIIFTVISIVVIIIGTQVTDLWPMGVVGLATLVISIIILAKGIIVMKRHLKKIQQDMNQSILDVPVVSGYHPQAVAPSSAPPPYPGHERDINLGLAAPSSSDPPPYAEHERDIQLGPAGLTPGPPADLRTIKVSTALWSYAINV